MQLGRGDCASHIVQLTMTRTRAFKITAFFSIAAVAGWLLLALFEPPLDYRVHPVGVPLDSEQFLRIIEAVADSQIHRNTIIEPLPNGELFYKAQLAAIKAARHSISLEAYIFSEGEVTRRFVEAMAERARSGVKVKVVLDAVGSVGTSDFMKPLTDAGGHVAYYHPIHWYTFPRMNNRTHREILILDGTTAFVGGAGYGDQWLHAKDGFPRWRDTVFKIEGDAVGALQGTLAENWVEASGEILTAPEFYKFDPAGAGRPAYIVDSTPGSGRSTRARMMYQTLLANAKETVEIATPYFLPDDPAVAEMVRALQRGVKLRILVPGEKTDHAMTRSSSRATYGDLLQHGAEIYEYQPSMLHTKAMVVDGLWCVVGSTNIDNRSFGLNDELNVASVDPALAARIRADFENDLKQARRITIEEWRKRGLFERVVSWFGWLLERQQ